MHLFDDAILYLANRLSANPLGENVTCFCLFMVFLLGCNRGRNVAGDSTIAPEALSADVRITEEPYYAQDIMNQKMDILNATSSKARD